MTELQKTFFLFAFAAFIGTTAFNATHFLVSNSNSLAAAIEKNRTFTSRVPRHAALSQPVVSTKKGDVPTEVQASFSTFLDGTDRITVTWKGTATGDNGYSIYRKSATESEYTFIKDVSADVTTYIDKNILPDTTYIYKIKTWASLLSEESNPARIAPKEESINTVFGEIEL